MKKKKQMRNITIGIVAVFAAAIVFAVAVSGKQFKADDVYVVVDDREYTKQEFDYYYYSCVNNFVNTYGQFAAYMGLDITGDLSKQQFSAEKTWEDYFYEMAVDTMSADYAVISKAKEAGFDYNTDEVYDAQKASFDSIVAANNTTAEAYYKDCYGPFATEANVEPLMREMIYASAYEEHLIENKEVTDVQVTETYESDKDNYDYYDYRSFVIEAEVTEEMTEEQVKTAMDAAKATAEEFVGRWEKGEDFNELCLEYVPEDQKTFYENDGSLAKGVRLSSASEMFKEWLSSAETKTNEIDIFPNEEYDFYAVAVLENRYFDDAAKEELRGELAEQFVVEEIEGWKAELSILHKK